MSRFVVPIKHPYKEDIKEVIIQADTAEKAMLIANGDFQRSGWKVDTDYQSYRQFKG